jgi:hypothetical protein
MTAKLALALLLAMAGTPVIWAGFWDISLPPDHLGQRFPLTAEKPVWDQTDLNVLCVVQAMDGLGRKQISEFESLKPRIGGRATAALFSIDRDNGKWPLAYLEETWGRMRLKEPIFELPPEARKLLYRGFDPQRIRILPQTFLISRDHRILRILEGFQTAEAIEEAVQETRSRSLSPPVLLSKSPVPGYANGDFQPWPAESRLPSGWLVVGGTTETFLRTGANSSSGPDHPEIRSRKGSSRVILFQRLFNPEALLGKKVRLSASAMSNCIAKPVVALGIPTADGGKYRFALDSPFTSRDGKKIPIRVLVACDFEDKTSAWQSQSHEMVLPDQGKVFAVMVYLENQEDPGAAAVLGGISLEFAD